MDGTFKSRPLLFAQLYVFHYQYRDHVIPGIFVLMENRQQQTYAVLFDVITNSLPANARGGPELFSVDFELGAVNSFKETFPESREAYCFFHLAQSLWQKLQESGHASAYLEEDNTELRLQFHAIISICFVPPDDVPEAFRLLQENCLDELDEVINHIEDYYVLGRRRGRGRRPPRYPIPS